MSQHGQHVTAMLGLGNMGAVLAANLVAHGHVVPAYDPAGSEERAPHGASPCDSLDEVCEAGASTVVLSLPNGTALARVVEDLRRLVALGSATALRCVVDTSTVGPDAARQAHSKLAESGIGYVDAPVSGGVAAARAGSIVLMCAGADEDVDAVAAVVDALTSRVMRVGAAPGLGQATKLANNYLSATSIVAVSEAVQFAISMGVDPAVFLEVVSLGSGRSSATSDKFPNYVLPGTYDSGFSNTLMAKDLSLYAEAAEEAGVDRMLSLTTVDVWRRFADAETDADHTRIHPFLRSGDAG